MTLPSLNPGKAFRVATVTLLCLTALGGQEIRAHAFTLPFTQSETRKEQARQLVAEGRKALERGDDEGAKNLFRRAVILVPDEVEAHTFLGVLADRAGDLKEAERHFSAAAIAAPFMASARNNYGVILMRTNRPQLAAAQFEASLKLDQNQPSALANLAQIRFASGRAKEMRAARELFKRAQNIAPDLEIARALLVISLRLGEKESAAAEYRDYVNGLSNDGSESAASAASSRAELGQALLEAGLLDEALRELDASLKLEPANAAAKTSLRPGARSKRLSHAALRPDPFTLRSPMFTKRAAIWKTRFRPCV
jgi:Flp pilus assembly protein TadD